MHNPTALLVNYINYKENSQKFNKTTRKMWTICLVFTVLSRFWRPSLNLFVRKCVLWLWQATPLLGWAEVEPWPLTPKKEFLSWTCDLPIFVSTVGFPLRFCHLRRRNVWWGRFEGTKEKDPSPNTKAFAIFPAYVSKMCVIPLLVLIRTPATQKFYFLKRETQTRSISNLCVES